MSEAGTGATGSREESQMDIMIDKIRPLVMIATRREELKLEASKMAKWVKVTAAMSDNLGLIPGTYTVEEDNLFLQVSSAAIHSYVYTFSLCSVFLSPFLGLSLPPPPHK